LKGSRSFSDIPAFIGAHGILCLLTDKVDDELLDAAGKSCEPSDL
jgi:hypothetical protein